MATRTREPAAGAEKRSRPGERIEVTTVAEIERRYPNEWVLLEVVRDHRDTMRVKGCALGHSPNRDDLNEPYERFRREHPRALTFEWYTGDIAPEGVTVIL